MEHTPVLLKEVIEFLDPHQGEFIIDGTVDGGGHASVILQKIMPGGKFLGLDWDKELLAKCRERLGNQKGLMLANGNYAELPEILSAKKLGKADGLLIDLGFSSEQLEGLKRGFSFAEASADEPLFMTYNDSQEPVYKILREKKESEIADIIYQFGGERMSRRIAKEIKMQEKRKPILTSGELAETVRRALPRGYERGRIDPATRTFQALRIYANGELGNLTTLLQNIENIVKPGGRVAIISFHSLEDGMVKRAFRTMAKESKAKLLIKKPVGPSVLEIKENPRSRSAKLRAAMLL